MKKNKIVLEWLSFRILIILAIILFAIPLCIFWTTKAGSLIIYLGISIVLSLIGTFIIYLIYFARRIVVIFDGDANTIRLIRYCYFVKREDRIFTLEEVKLVVSVPELVKNWFDMFIFIVLLVGMPMRFDWWYDTKDVSHTWNLYLLPVSVQFRNVMIEHRIYQTVFKRKMLKKVELIENTLRNKIYMIDS